MLADFARTKICPDRFYCDTGQKRSKLSPYPSPNKTTAPKMKRRARSGLELRKVTTTRDPVTSLPINPFTGRSAIWRNWYLPQQKFYKKSTVHARRTLHTSKCRNELLYKHTKNCCYSTWVTMVTMTSNSGVR